MPRRYARKGKRTHRRRRRRWKRKAMGVPSGMPLQRMAKLRYADTISLTSTLGSFASYAFGANDIYDPDITGTGHQPMGYDQWTALFNHYVVLGSKITISVVSDGTARAIFGCYLADDTSIPYSSGVQLVEAKKGTYTTLASQRNPQYVRSFFSAKKYYNVKDVKDNLDRLGASTASSPTDKAVFIIYYNTLDGATETTEAIVQIDYIVSFSEPKDLTQS